MIRIVKSVFTSLGTEGDFTWMIEQPQYAGALFIFNDNEREFIEFRAGRGGLHAGGGNAAIRPYRGHTPPRAAGIPTGTTYGYPALTSEVRDVIDAAIVDIELLLTTYRYTSLIFSYDPVNNTLGAGIFDPAAEVKNYIMESIYQLSRA